MNYDSALKATCSETEDKVQQLRKNFTEVFEDFVSQMSPESIEQKVKATYASDAYFNDTLQELNGRDEIAWYMERSLAATNGVSVTVEDVAFSGVDFYYRWKMKIFFKSLNKGKPGISDGMSQIRYTDDGYIVMHRDFWDAASGFFAYLPVLRTAIPWVKGRL
ncbi:MAG: nuclear transport factor 2 family protein [Candidatus Latescibacterota bacterium]|nr:nuclear transport factor 2 family protein [Candidatus Latescibacterota bacterium]